MSMRKSKAFLFCLSLLAVIACGHDDDENGGSGGGGNYTPQELVVKGKVEKGPFISGSVISMQPLNEKMQATGSSYTTTITDDYGSFTFNPEKFEEPYARLSVSGYFYNEYKGKLSQGQITLQSVVDVKEYLEQHYSERITLDDLASRFYINKYYLTRVFKEQYGMSITSYLTSLRITHAKQLLRFTDKTVEEIGLECGLGALHYFSRVFKEVEGVAPSTYRAQW